MERTNKFKDMIHYICWKCGDPSKLGAVKLNKVAWFSDVISFLEIGEPITNARYTKQKYGPVPKAILPILRELQAEERLRIEDVPFYGKTKKQYISLTEPNAGAFTEEQRAIIDMVVDAVCDGHTAGSISELTHDDIWKLAAVGEEIPLHAILASEFAEVTDKDVERVTERMKDAA